MKDQFHEIGVNLLDARNRAIGELVLEVPPPLVAEAFEYSTQVVFLYTNRAAEPWARYADRRSRSRENRCIIVRLRRPDP